MILGEAALWSDTFPDHLIPRLLDLVVSTWERFPKPNPAEHEVPITRRFKHALKQAKDLQRLPVRIERESAEDDLASGAEVGRIDLKFLPAASAREEIYFAFECKRLNILRNGCHRSLAAEYISDGMMRFITGQYSSSVASGGMLGYVLQGRTAQAAAAVDKKIESEASALRMRLPAGLDKSSLRPDDPRIRETSHGLDRGVEFRIYHIFLDCCN